MGDWWPWWNVLELHDKVSVSILVFVAALCLGGLFYADEKVDDDSFWFFFGRRTDEDDEKDEPK
jgi:hypothetical protein